MLAGDYHPTVIIIVGLDAADYTASTFEQQWSTILTEFTASVEGPTSLPIYIAFGEAFAGS